MADCAFLIVPTIETVAEDGWEQLGRAARLDRLTRQFEELGTQIRARLFGLEMEYLEGLGGWTVRSPAPMSREELILRLAGLPVEVAPDERFYAL